MDIGCTKVSGTYIWVECLFRNLDDLICRKWDTGAISPTVDHDCTDLSAVSPWTWITYLIQLIGWHIHIGVTKQRNKNTSPAGPI